jgi:hypothetical protein
LGDQAAGQGSEQDAVTKVAAGDVEARYAWPPAKDRAPVWRGGAETSADALEDQALNGWHEAGARSDELADGAERRARVECAFLLRRANEHALAGFGHQIRVSAPDDML